MENIGDWLYLIFIAIAVIAGMIKPKKKQDASSPPPVAHDRNPWESATQQQAEKKTANTQQKPLSWQEILQSLSEEAKKTQTQKTAQPQAGTQKVSTQKQSASSKKVTAKPFLAGESSKKKAPVTSSIAERIKHFEKADNQRYAEETSIQLNFDDPEEIKKGIIYAEIFNRKY